MKCLQLQYKGFWSDNSSRNADLRSSGQIGQRAVSEQSESGQRAIREHSESTQHSEHQNQSHTVRAYKYFVLFMLKLMLIPKNQIMDRWCPIIFSGRLVQCHLAFVAGRCQPVCLSPVIVTNNVGKSGWGQGPQKLISVTPHCHCLITVNMKIRNLCPPDERTEYS